jgi:hypothetical protein
MRFELVASALRGWAFLVGMGLACAACGDDPSGAPMCIDPLPETCDASYPATWDNIYRFVVAPRCGGSSGSSCHGPQGLKGNLALHEKEGSYQALLGMDGTPARVLPADAACSGLMERLTTTDVARRMPLGSTLDAGEICAVQKWIEEGANP